MAGALVPLLKGPLMASRFIDKEHGTDSLTAITDSASNREKVRNLPDAVGFVFDRVDGFFKYNDLGTIRTLVNTNEAQTLTNKTVTSAIVNENVSIVTTNQTLVAADSGKIYIANAADLVFTLPATVAGLRYTFVNAALSAGVGLSASPVAADAINEGVDNKDLINSGATDVLGDSVTVIGDGSTGWYTTSKIGTWAAEA